MYLDDEGSTRCDLQNFDLGPASGGWTIDVANDEFWDDRGNYSGNQPEAKWSRSKNRPAGTALPFGVSYEKFRNPGRDGALTFDGAGRAPRSPAPDGEHALVGRVHEPERHHPRANGLPRSPGGARR